MKDQLVSFKTAKLAKEKGFDEECINHFSDTKNPFIDNMLRQRAPPNN